MKYKAVIFDLGGTLYPETSQESRKTTISAIAAALSVSLTDFEPLWNAGFRKQMQGGLMNCSQYLEHICSQIGVSISSDRLTKGVDVFSESIRQLILWPRPEAESVLGAIREKGLKNGLVSNAESFLADTWETSPIAHLFDAVVFSCSVGLRKPDPRIWRLAIDKLSVQAQECLYIADGKYQELSGASNIGFKAIRLRVPGETDNDADRQNWNGISISSLTEVLSLLN